MTSYKILFLALVLALSLAESDVEEVESVESVEELEETEETEEWEEVEESFETLDTKEVDELIHGGKDAKRGAFPYQAGITKDNNYICGGSLISNNYVVSAAHCFHKKDKPNRYHVYLGSIQILKGTKRQVRRLLIHPRFKNYHNDIALLKIDAVRSSTDIKTVKIPNNDHPFLYADAIISGWGVYRANQIKPILQYTELQVFENAKCRILSNGKRITGTNICAGDSKKGSTPCMGDSGSPLIDKKTKLLIGIASFADSAHNCIKQPLSAYTRVSSYRKWIQNEIKK